MTNPGFDRDIIPTACQGENTMFNTRHLSPLRFASKIAAFTLLLGSRGFAQHYIQTDLTANSKSVSGTATIDPNLVNAWGLSRSSSSFWWISDNGMGLSTLYDGTGAIGPLVVTIPPPKNGTAPSAPTGTAFNFSKGFDVAPTLPAVFLFVTEGGTIAGWNPGVDVNNAVTKVDRSQEGAIFKGVTIAKYLSTVRLYATNFSAGTVDVYDRNFNIVTAAGGFKDSALPADYVPFGIQNVGGNIVVTFAHRKPGSKDEDHGTGVGYVDIFDLDGNLLVRVQHGPYFNAPWGIALAPSDFGSFAHRLLIGNFGDGTIHAFNIVSGKFVGVMLNSGGTSLTIDGLWALSFAGNSTNSGSNTELYFTAGPNDESNGLFGKLTATATEQLGNSE
jgi:uncharacterized protein (TIGR03118 family)